MSTKADMTDYPPELVERVARAIYEYGREYWPDSPVEPPWENAIASDRDMCLRFARAALDASGLRETRLALEDVNVQCEELEAERDALQQRERELVEAALNASGLREAQQEIAWLRRLLGWSRARLKHASYQTWLDRYLALGPSEAPQEEPPIIHSEMAERDALQQRIAELEADDREEGAVRLSFAKKRTEIIADLENKIDALQQRERELVEALKPFAEAAADLSDETRDRSDVWELPAAMSITAGELRNAAAALARARGENNGH